ncbi:zinc-ribbon domain-containing protein [Acetobacteraceae bacterium H6797]|nr:zinc-ribbon domain-containing protein [Acetobacteraceae bacterium H6797]
MRVECPHCAALYDIPDHLLAGGTRSLRCARCAHEWVPGAGSGTEAAPETAATADSSPPEPELPPGAEEDDGEEASFHSAADREAMLAPPPPPEPASSGGALWFSWAASLALLAGGAAGAWVWRDAVMEAWPPAAHLFAWLGG